MKSSIEYTFGRRGMAIIEYLIVENPDKEVNQMDIMTDLHMSHHTVQNALSLFLKRGYIIVSRQIAKSKFYTLVCTHPVIMAIANVIDALANSVKKEKN